MARNALLGMAQMPTLQYRPETQVESLGKATQAVGGLQSIQMRQMEMEKAKQDAAMLQQFRQKMAQAGKNPDPSVYGQALIETGRPDLVVKGSEIMRAVQSEKRLQSILSGSFGAPSTAAPVAAAPATITQPPAAPAITATTFDEGAARPEMPRPSIAARTAGVEPPMPMGPVRELPPVEQRTGRNALAAPAAAAPAAAPVNQLAAAAAPQTAAPAPDIAGMERQYDALLLEGATNPAARAIAQQLRARIDKLKPKEYAPIELERLNALVANLPPGSPERKVYEARIAKLTAESKGVTLNLPPQEQQERKARGDLLVEQYKDVSKAASLAARTLPALDVQERVLNAGFETGFGTDAQKAAASVLARLGVPEAKEYATNAQTFLAATQQAVLQRQLEQKGPQTESDAQRITQTGAQLGNTTDANRFIIAVAKAQLKRDIEQRNFYDSWWKKNKTYDGAEDAWFSGAGSKSLFEDPVLKSFAPERGRVGGEAAGGVPPYADPEKERRYQEWKRNQGKP